MEIINLPNIITLLNIKFKFLLFILSLIINAIVFIIIIGIIKINLDFRLNVVAFQQFYQHLSFIVS